MKKTLCALMVLVIFMALASCVSDGNARATEGLSYAMRTDGTYEVTGIGSATDLDIVIPSSYEGVSVSAIKSGAFSGCSKVTTASYASGLQSIGAYAYQDCSSVRDVYIPSSVTNLGASIFYNCASITNITTATAHQSS